MNSPSWYIHFVQEAAYLKLAIANQVPEKIPLPEFFRGSPLHLFFFWLCPMEMTHISKTFLCPEGDCCFQLSPSVRI